MEIHKIIMTTLEQFYKLKDAKFTKFQSLFQEGKTSQEAFSLMESDIKEMVSFIKEHQEELQEALTKDFQEMFKENNIDPMLGLILSIMFTTPLP